MTKEQTIEKLIEQAKRDRISTACMLVTLNNVVALHRITKMLSEYEVLLDSNHIGYISGDRIMITD
jgi:hypothetical protein